ncbi:MAG TPA: hypothetical protein VE134_06995, partial [Methanomicrobiales archaeon]|nr:hypothetical protein [Methanomicrobiales archaeon]
PSDDVSSDLLARTPPGWTDWPKLSNRTAVRPREGRLSDCTERRSRLGRTWAVAVWFHAARCLQSNK